MLKLTAPASRVDVKLYSQALVLVGGAGVQGDWPAGWTRPIALPAALAAKMGAGAYYAQVTASSDKGASDKVLVKLVYLK